MLTATYIFRSGKFENTGLQTQTVYAVFTPVVISHFVMFVLRNNNL